MGGAGSSQANGSTCMSLEEALRSFQLPQALDDRAIWLWDYSADALCEFCLLDSMEGAEEVECAKAQLRQRLANSRAARISDRHRRTSRRIAGGQRGRRRGQFIADDSAGERVAETSEVGAFTASEDRGLGALLGLAVGDALGAPLEFAPVTYSDDQKDWVLGFDDPSAWKDDKLNRFRLQPGQWTDDTSMALCLADSLLQTVEFCPLDLRVRFLNWWHFGYNNAFAADAQRRTGEHGGGSVGLGGSIQESLAEFVRDRTELTRAGDRYTSGNGGIMRLAPVPIFHHKNAEEAIRIAALQSRTTHQGEEAEECARLLAHIIVSAISHPASSPSIVRGEVLGSLGETFPHTSYAGACLAAAEPEKRHPDNEGANLQDRVWNWRSDDFRYSPARVAEDEGYVGSYCMDALAMALHAVWTTRSLEAAVLKAANRRGDADTVAAVAGQIAGAIYGVSAIPEGWLDAVHRWDRHGDILLRAHRLFSYGT